MVAANFEAALEHVFKMEGGYSDHPLDPGGATNYGITRGTLSAWRGVAVSKAEVQALTREEAGRIYRKNYWDAVVGDQLPAGLDLALFDHGVNSGPARAARTLQSVLGVPVDGQIGAQTLQALAGCDAREIINMVLDRRLAGLKRLPTWKTFGLGWQRRIDAIRAAALKSATQLSLQPKTQAKQEPVPMLERKSFFASKTVWGALIAIAAQLLMMAGYPVPADAQTALVDVVTQVIGVGGTMFALWGRLAATTKLH